MKRRDRAMALWRKICVGIFFIWTGRCASVFQPIEAKGAAISVMIVQVSVENSSIYSHIYSSGSRSNHVLLSENSLWWFNRKIFSALTGSNINLSETNDVGQVSSAELLISQRVSKLFDDPWRCFSVYLCARHSWKLAIVKNFDSGRDRLTDFYLDTIQHFYRNGRPKIDVDKQLDLCSHLFKLGSIDASDAYSNHDEYYFTYKFPRSKSLPPWRLTGIAIGIVMFAWGRWTTAYTRRQITERTAILGIIAMIGGIILALWSV